MRNINLSVAHWLLDPTATSPFTAPFNLSKTPQGGPAQARYSPPVDILQSDESYVLTADIPGVDPSTVEVSVQDGVLSLKGERVAVTGSGSGAVQRRERRLGVFERSFNLPEGTPVDNIEVHAAHGALEITIPKAVAESRKVLAIQGARSQAASSQSSPAVQSTA